VGEKTWNVPHIEHIEISRNNGPPSCSLSIPVLWKRGRYFTVHRTTFRCR